MTSGSLGLSIHESGIGSILIQNSLTVPLNQRSYAWDETHVKTLLTDFSGAINSTNKKYFLGTIVLSQSAPGKPEVADGQQRLATTAILIGAIRDYLFKGTATEKNAADKYKQNYLLEFDETAGEHTPKLKLNLEDNDFFLKSVLLDPDEPARGSVKASTDSHERIARVRQDGPRAFRQAQQGKSQRWRIRARHCYDEHG